MIKINKDLNHEKELQSLKAVDSPFLIKTTGNYFYFKGFYCFPMEFCEVQY